MAKTSNPKIIFDQLKAVNQFCDTQIVQGHILKFIKKEKSHKDRGIICYPQQTYGNAQESPDHFKSSYGKVPKNGYLYKHQNKPQFQYFSQKRYFSIDGSTNQNQSAKIHYQDKQLNQNAQKNVFKFHRKKGKLTQFMDKNGWMNKATKIMGFQRDQIARQLQIKDRKRRIQSLKPKIIYQNKSAIRPDTTVQYFRTIGSLTSRKMKIRSQRNSQAQRFSQSIQPRNIRTSHRVPSQIQQQTINQRMLKTARDFSPSRQAKVKLQQYNTKTFYNPNRNRLYKFQRNFNVDNQQRQYGWRQNFEESLEDWYNTTCSSKWVYNKKIDSQQEEGLNLLQ